MGQMTSVALGLGRTRAGVLPIREHDFMNFVGQMF